MSVKQANMNLYIDSAGEATNPSDNDVMCDTGEVARSGFYDVHVITNASAASHFSVQHRNAANDGNVTDPFGIYMVAGGTAEHIWPLYLNVYERVRVTMDDALTGTAWCSINAKLVG